MVARRKRGVPDIRSAKDMGLLKEVLGNHPLTLVLIYADWCGHCHTYKDSTWKELANTPNRKVGLAQLNSDVLPESPFSNAKIQGYPSVLVVGKDGKPAEFVEDGDPTNALPNSRDTAAMKEFITAPDPSALNASNLPTSSLDLPPSSLDPTPSPTNEAANLMKSSVTSPNVTLPPVNTKTLTVPDVEEDVLRSQNAIKSIKASTPDFPMAGGSLYSALLDATTAVAPAALLTVGAIAASRKQKSKGKSRKGSRGRSRSNQKLRGRTLKRFLNTFRRRR